MTLRLKINKKIDNKLAENFPQQPYPDINIQLQQITLRLSVAYLAMDSHTFAQLPPGAQTYDLTQFDQDGVIAVLRSLYGGPLQCSSPAALDMLWPIIDHLSIQDYQKNIQEGIAAWLDKKQGGSGTLEWIDVCLRRGLAVDWLIKWLTAQDLRILESTKNYLQLGKMSDYSINFILLQYVKERPENTIVVNTVLENYFNRKGHSPNQYFKSSQLSPLKSIWDQNHHRFKGNRLQKTNSINYLAQTTISSLRTVDRDPKEPQTASRIRKSIADCISSNLDSQVQTPLLHSEEKSLDMRISVLSNQLQQKNKLIKTLRDELEQLQMLKAKRIAEQQAANEESMFDIALLKSRMKSKKQKHQSESVSQYALDVPSKRLTETEQKLKVVSRELNERKQ